MQRECGHRMTVPTAEVLRHSLRTEASRPEYSGRRDEILAWCEGPDSELFMQARAFAEDRDDINPAVLYTAGTRQENRSAQIACWTKENIRCRDLFTNGIA